MATHCHPTGLADDDGDCSTQGLYVSTEMFVNGMMHLIEQGIVKRKVYDNLQLQLGINAGRISALTSTSDSLTTAAAAA